MHVTYINIYLAVCGCQYMCMRVCMQLSVCVCARTCVFLCVYVRVYVCVCMRFVFKKYIFSVNMQESITPSREDLACLCFGCLLCPLYSQCNSNILLEFIIHNPLYSPISSLLPNINYPYF